MPSISLSSSARSIQRRARPTIGITVPWSTDNNYIVPIWQGAIDAAQAHDVNLLAFAGKQFWLENQQGYLPDALRHMNTATVDGMITLSAPLGSIRQMGGYGAFPIITISESNPECPGIIPDNESGIQAAMAHLIQEHGCRRIAFVQGVGADAVARFRAYTEALKKYRLPIDEQLILPGSYDIASGESAARTLLERRSDFDAIVAANDLMAMGAMQALQEQGVMVPYTVAVVGFDDAQEAQFSTPPLTTVRQPLHRMGWRAVELVLAQLSGETLPVEEEIVPTELVIRQSCGCLSVDVQQAASQNAGDRIGGVQNLLGRSFQLPAARRISIAEEMRQRLNGSGSGLDADWAEQLVDAFSDAMNHTSRNALLTAVDRVSRQIMTQGVPVSSLQGPLSVLRRQTQFQGPDSWRAEDMWQQTRVFVSEAALRQQAQRRALAEAEDAVLRQIGETMIVTFDVARLMDLIARELPRLDIHQLYVALYEKFGSSTEYARLVLAQKDGQRLPVEASGQRILARDLLPIELLPARRYQLLMMPLHFREELLGFVVFDISSRKKVAALYEVLRSQLSSALKGAQLISHVAGNAQGVSTTSAQLAEAVTQSSEATSQIATAMEQVAHGAHLQAEAVTRSATAVERLANDLGQVTAHAQASTESAAQMTEIARSGAQLIQDNMDGMQDIKAIVDVAAQKVKEMGARSKEIGTIIATIDDIASETNFLALNAELEAARAGKHGRGFAIVATEVRKLSKKSALATKEIGKLIHNIQQTIQEVVVTMEDSDQDVTRGVEQAVASQQALTQVLSVVEAVNQRVAEISAAAASMMAEANTVMETMDSIAGVSESNSAASQEVSAATTQMNAQMQAMSSLAQSLADMAQGMHTLVIGIEAPDAQADE